MHSILSNEKVTLPPVAAPAAIAPADRWRGLVELGDSVAAALRRRFRRAAVIRQLMALDDRMLADIGIERWQIVEVAESVTAKSEAAADGPFRRIAAFVRDRLVAPIWRVYRRRAAYRELMALDDHMLKDIGLTRGDIPAVVSALSDETDGREDVADAAAERDSESWSLRFWNRSRSAAKALYALDDRMLSDIGLVRGDVDWVARELAKRSLRKPANRNQPPRAA